MTKLILSTGNIVSGGPSIIRKPGAYRSNLELTNSLRSNFLAAQQAAAADIEADIAAAEEDEEYLATASGNSDSDDIGFGNGSAYLHAFGNGTGTTSSSSSRRPPLATWTQREGSVLYVPRLDWTDGGAVTGLSEEASQYETTVKLFFVSGAQTATPAERGVFAEEALRLVFGELGISRADLLVISFPGGGEGEDESGSRSVAPSDSDDIVAATWAATAEALQAQGKVARLGVAEFGAAQLGQLLDRVAVAPAVDQVNLQRCCSVPPDLATLARRHNIELLVHTDCTDVLPPGTLRELLGPGLQGAGVLAGGPVDDLPAGDSEALRGDLTPQWVVKYTAVVRDRGVIENKGYFAGASLRAV
ncbi:gamma-cysteine synthetase regulatory [Grosmannia clavigera kw1407]|uniref:GCS light chain n=1 Tax=Grosmannia clavigera (strain kw1407 / UAMH 11150) TaxID=655863 RepID=F0XCP2_GROCL|nr:gamma-cysteine synthetase regulatory [Grosmannia clavigera kw1407]EFX04340.1 gamma-cysteine synthetase regulatory [Grosmannia clavigera kw1407]